MSDGVDVSKHQGIIDWHAARSTGTVFAYIKITEGIGYVDPKADIHLRGARAAGLITGGYHFARPDTNSPEADAQHFATEIRARGLAEPGCLPPCLDLERSAGVDYIDWAQRFLATLRRITGYQPAMVYASTSWWSKQLGGGRWLDANTWAWVAHYGKLPGQPGYRSERTVMHQYADRGRISGYDADIDVNTCWVDLATLTSPTIPDSDALRAARNLRPVPPWPLPREHYFGLISGPERSHGGYFPAERPWVKQIQQALQRKGYAPETPGWADGRFEDPTAEAVATWQRDHMPGTRFYGQVWADDWARLLA